VAKSTSKSKSSGISEKDLHGWRLLAGFRERIGPVLAAAEPSRTEEDVRRTLHAGNYLSMVLFGMINPTLKSMRALCAASGLERMREEVCGTQVSLGSFSEMQGVVDAGLLEGVLRELSAEALPCFGKKSERDRVGDLLAVDGTLLPSLPRMAWALWQDERHRAGKLHLEFSVWDQVPVECEVTHGNASERAAWRAKLRPNVCYVADRGYGHDYGLIREVDGIGASFVLRLQSNTVYEELEPVRSLGEADSAAGVVKDVRVRLGGKPGGPEGRLVTIEADGHTFLLFTNLGDIEAELVGAVYRYRWQIELFFKWIKCILGCRHWFAESRNGVTIQIYCALIASMLLVLWLGRKPSKRQWEALQFYWMGWATLEELEALLLKKPAKKSGR